MKVIVEDAIFRAPSFHLRLLNLFQLAIEKCHRIDIDVYGSHFCSWLQARGGDEREECEQAIAISVSQEAREPSKIAIVVDDIPASDWSSEIPQLTIADALQVLRKPFNILLEDNVSDRNFLLCLTTPEQKKFLLDLEREGALVFDNGGGVTNMKKRISSYIKENLDAKLRTWALFDSDALRPGKPSKQSEDVRKACGQIIPHHQLVRRYSESYLTRQALEHWTVTISNKTDEARYTSSIQAFFRMRPDQRHHFNMKQGFNGDSSRTEEAGGIYDDLATRDRNQLCKGFGRKISDLFADGSVTESDLKEDGSWNEMIPVVTRLIALIR